MYGAGPQTNASCPVYGRASSVSAAAVGRPCTDSSQWCTTRRDGCPAASAASFPAKITDRSSRLAYTSTTRPLPDASALFTIDSTGVMPLPAANSSRSSSSDDGVKIPAGASDSSSSPAVTESQIQFEP
jgi:hypothetical protein